MKDYPEILRVNLAACQVAPHIHAAKCEAYGGSSIPWADLSQASRRLYIEIAADLIRQFKPDRTSSSHETLLRLVRK
jgi:hypothetical protein